MKNNSRTKYSIRNLTFAMTGQVVGLVVSLISRLVFVRYLTTDYLGLSGLFSNILTMLCLVELGIGPAMTYSLYKPLAEDDQSKIKGLMGLYKKVYNIVGIVVIILGFMILPFYRFLIKDVPSISHLDIIFILFVLNTAVSYFYSYKQSLINADQKRYITTCFQYAFFTLLQIVQIIVLIFTQNYIVFLITQVIFTWVQNVAVSKYADNMYPYLKNKGYDKLSEEDLNPIKKNVGAMVFHKVGSMVVLATDNILISRILGLFWVGLYSNYNLITKSLNNVIYQVFNSIVASVGNLGVQEDKEKVTDVFEKVFFLDFWIYGFSSICLFVLFNPFIRLWLGEKYLLDEPVVFIIVLNFYIYGMLKAVRTFRDASGLYYYDRYKPIFEAVINLVASIIFARKIGLSGILIGTIVSTLTTCFWVEPWVLYRKCLSKPLRTYFILSFKYFAITSIVGTIAYGGCSLLPTHGLVAFVSKVGICTALPNLLFLLIFFRSEELMFYKKVLSPMFIKLVSRESRKLVSNPPR